MDNYIERKFILWTTAILLIVVIIFYALRPTDKSWPGSPQTQRYRNITRIGSALRHYADSHGGIIPDRLSQLIPKYISSTNINWLFWPPRMEFANNSSWTADEISRLIDQEGAFVYLGIRGIQYDIVLIDRPELWAIGDDGTTAATMTAKFTARLRSVSDVTNLIGQLLSEIEGK